MATGWVRSLQCKSKSVVEDVYLPKTKHLNHLLTSSSCRKSVQSIKDVVLDTTTQHKKNPRKKQHQHNPPSSTKPTPRNRYKPLKPEPHYPITRTHTHDPFFPTLIELKEGHPSRNVVEIIFHTSWTPKSFSGRVEMLFKVQNLPKTVTRFEEYREMVKIKAVKEDNVRCIADGNEMMRFHCVGPTVYDVGGECTFFPVKDSAICTFSGSGGAHESCGGGGGKGRRAMLVCRVIAGSVCKRVGLDSFLEGRVGFDSVSGENGELLVFYSRAVLPCFLIIYRL